MSDNITLTLTATRGDKGGVIIKEMEKIQKRGRTCSIIFAMVLS